MHAYKKYITFLSLLSICGSISPAIAHNNIPNNLSVEEVQFQAETQKRGSGRVDYNETFSLGRGSGR